eukprot:gene36251-43105_t
MHCIASVSNHEGAAGVCCRPIEPIEALVVRDASVAHATEALTMRGFVPCEADDAEGSTCNLRMPVAPLSSLSRATGIALDPDAFRGVRHELSVHSR